MEDMVAPTFTLAPAELKLSATMRHQPARVATHLAGQGV